MGIMCCVVCVVCCLRNVVGDVCGGVAAVVVDVGDIVEILLSVCW